MAGLGWRHPHYAQVLAQRPALDFLEVHSENFFGDGGPALQVLLQGRAHYDISLHGVGLSLGSAVGLDPWHLARLARLVEQVEPVRVSDHASFARAPLVGAGTVHAADLLPVPWTHEALAVMVANVQQVQDRLGRQLAVENLSAYLTWADADWSEPDFLTELARRSGCALLVDVNNLMVNALNAHGAPTRDALLAQPVQRAALVRACCDWLDALGANVPVAEIHLAGHVHTGQCVIDDHGSRVSDDVWTVYRHAIRRVGHARAAAPGTESQRIVPTLIEWDTDVPELSVLLDEVALADMHAQQALAAQGAGGHASPTPPATAVEVPA